MNLFDPISVSVAHQRAVQIEKRLKQRSCGVLLAGIGSSTGGVSCATGSSGPGQRANGSGPGQRASGSGPVQCAPPTVTPTNRMSTSCERCFGYGEISHRPVDCKKQGKKALFLDLEDYEEKDVYVGEELVFDVTNEGDKEILEGDIGLALVVRHMCLMPRANEDEWLCNNIFQCTCTIEGKVCRFIIDAGSCENIVSIEAM